MQDEHKEGRHVSSNKRIDLGDFNSSERVEGSGVRQIKYRIIYVTQYGQREILNQNNLNYRISYITLSTYYERNEVKSNSTIFELKYSNRSQY